ncbi:MAG TPA: SDR family oxidoreductase [Burkholderiaceae bacterium]|nr:SDR family oxidoreductase [Burkholderiaceae bacterium]
MPELMVVTGAAGFLGSHLCDTLVERGYDVLALDDFSTGTPSNLAHLQPRRGFRLVRHDITEPLPAQADGASGIFNLACPASPLHYQRRPVQTVLASTIGLNHVLETARRANARVLQASTSEVYGDPLVHPQNERYFGNVNPLGPRACYDEGKRCAEALCIAYRRQYGVQVRIARIFNSYGPRLLPGDGRVVSNFISQAIAGQPLTVYGSGEQTRSFCFVDDTIEGLVRLMQSDVEQPVNIGATDEHTMLEMAQIVLKLTGSNSVVERRPLPIDDPRRRRPDIGSARRLLNWAPRVSLNEGLRRTIAHFRQELQVPALRG